MKKLLGILVLGLLLSACESTVYIPGHGKIDTSHNCRHNDHVCNWNYYKTVTTAKVWGEISLGSYQGNPMWASAATEENALNILHAHSSCKAGCKVTHIRNKEISIERQLEIGKKYLPPSIYNKIFPQAKKTAKKKTTTENTATSKVEPASGTAFFVTNTGHIITNFHVIETCNNKSKIFYQNNELDVKLLAKDEYLDLALLKAEVSGNKFLKISNKAPRKLQRIIAAGYPFGKYLSDDMKFTSGIVSSLKGVRDDSTRLQIDAALNPGNSGGPIVDENTGELVAVAVAGLRKDMTESVNFGIKAASVKNFIESNQLYTKTLEKKYSTGDIANLLENSVLYTFCK